MNKLVWLIVILLAPSPWAAAAALAESYLVQLQQSITQTRSNLATLTKSADRAAHEFLAGGNLWVAGRQADFIAEVIQAAIYWTIAAERAALPTSPGP